MKKVRLMAHSLRSIQQYGADELSIHSFESGIYLVEANVNSDIGYVTDDSGEHLRFHSVQEATETFKKATVPSIWLIEETAYDEMCGSNECHTAPMKVPLRQKAY